MKVIGGGVRYSRKTGAVYSTPAPSAFDESTSKSSGGIIAATQGEVRVGDHKVATWGKDNLKPMRWRQLIDRSNITPQLLLTLVNFAAGEMLYAYEPDVVYDEKTGGHKIVRKPLKDPELKKWLTKIKARELVCKRSYDYYFSGNAPALMVLARDPQRFGVQAINHIDCTTFRLEMIDKKTKRINHGFIGSNWSSPRFGKSGEANVTAYKMWREEDPLKYYQSILHSKLYMAGNPYYGVQPWHSAENWIAFANKIPVWMNSNISNAAVIKFHVEYPANYFDYCKDWDLDKQKEEEDRVFNELDDFLAGEENVGKAWYTPVQYGHTGEVVGGRWKINSIENDILDKAWLDNYKTGLGAMTSAFDVNPSLANIPMEGKFAVSGSELRIAYQIHIALKVAIAREMILEPIHKAYMVNHELGIKGFSNPDLRIGIINRDILTLGEDKTGMNDQKNFNEAA